MEAKTIEEAMEGLRAMMESSKARRSTAQPQQDAKSRAKTKRAWLDKWLKLKPNHPQLKVLEDSIYAFCTEYGKRGDRGRRLLIYGENGSGKSHTSKAVSRWAKLCAIYLTPVTRHGETDNIESRSPRCLFRNWAGLLSDLKGSISNGGYAAEWDELLNVELLILDDVGADHDPSKFGVEKLYMLLEAREFRWTLITTNICPDDWGTRWERRVDSRLYRNFTHVDLSEVPDFNLQ